MYYLSWNGADYGIVPRHTTHITRFPFSSSRDRLCLMSHINSLLFVLHKCSRWTDLVSSKPPRVSPPVTRSGWEPRGEQGEKEPSRQQHASQSMWLAPLRDQLGWGRKADLSVSHCGKEWSYVVEEYETSSHFQWILLMLSRRGRLIYGEN